MSVINNRVYIKPAAGEILFCGAETAHEKKLIRPSPSSIAGIIQDVQKSRHTGHSTAKLYQCVRRPF
jgi:hypothetical protein